MTDKGRQGMHVIPGGAATLAMPGDCKSVHRIKKRIVQIPAR